jgi:hypothetical protein
LEIINLIKVKYLLLICKYSILQRLVRKLNGDINVSSLIFT